MQDPWLSMTGDKVPLALLEPTWEQKEQGIGFEAEHC